MKKIIVLCMLAALIALGVVVGIQALAFQKFLDTPLFTEVTDFEINKGAHIKSISRQLHREERIPKVAYLWLLAKYHGLEAVKAGIYEFDAKTKPLDFLSVINLGKVKQFSVTFVEGWTFKECLNELWRQKTIIKSLADLPYEDMMEKIAGKKMHPEGWLFPDTYFYDSGTSDLALLKRAYEKMQTFLAQAWEERNSEIPLAEPYQALILASIIEKETGAAHERPEIAGVFTRRLKKRMRLETDPTVIYGLGEQFDGNLTRKHLRTYTPYNTYRIKGLPPTPIAIPSADAIRSALNPKPGSSLFFVAKGNGEHYFSETLQEHNAAVRKYQLKK